MSLLAEHHSGERLITPSSFPLPDLLEPEGSCNAAGYKTLVLGGGCFWCVEGVFQPLQGVMSVMSGYSGDTEATAHYKEVCSGQTHHAEVVCIEYDPVVISRGQLLQVFFSVAHNPTHLNHQGADHGRQYRSVVFYSHPDEKKQVELYIHQLNCLPAWSTPIVTSLEPLQGFYAAEPEHQDYARRNPSQPYIELVAQPKKIQLQTFFGDRLK